MAEIQSAAFSVTVNNEAEIKAWLNDMGQLRDSLERQFNAFVELVQGRPLIRLTIHQALENDGKGGADGR